MRRPAVNFRHLRRLTDDTGILEHALGLVPRRKEGYSTDDQARALWVCVEWLELDFDRLAGTLLPLIDTYLAFMLWAQGEDGRFHNNISYDRRKEEETYSEDCLGRCMWAAALAAAKLPGASRRFAAQRMLSASLKPAGELQYVRGLAYAVAALAFCREALPEVDSSLLEPLARRLAGLHESGRRPGWPWPEPVVTYGNGVLPWALLRAHRSLADPRLKTFALEQLDFLIENCTDEFGRICPVGNQGWFVPGRKARWDQQPIDVMKLALAALEAYRVTGRERYRTVVERCRAWFHGDNELSLRMADPWEGSCCDGLRENGTNINCGAESTISYLLTEALYHRCLKTEEDFRDAPDDEQYATSRSRV